MRPWRARSSAAWSPGRSSLVPVARSSWWAMIRQSSCDLAERLQPFMLGGQRGRLVLLVGGDAGVHAHADHGCLLSLAVVVLWRAEEIRTGAGSQALSCRCWLALPQAFPGVDHDREHRACAVLVPYGHGNWRGAVGERGRDARCSVSRSGRRAARTDRACLGSCVGRMDVYAAAFSRSRPVVSVPRSSSTRKCKGARPGRSRTP